MKEEKAIPMNDKERLTARIPVSQWNDIERKMAIISRMTTEPARESDKGVSS